MKPFTSVDTIRGHTMVEGRADPATMAELAKRRMRSKMPLLEQALTGLVRDYHRQLLAMQLAHIDFLDEQIDALSAEIVRRLAVLSGDTSPIESPGAMGEAGRAATPAIADPSMTFARAVTLLDTIPGVNQWGGELLVAEWGIDMGRFSTAARLAAWSGIAPGNDESAGKQRSGKTRQGNQALRTGLITFSSRSFLRYASDTTARREDQTCASALGFIKNHFLLYINKYYLLYCSYALPPQAAVHIYNAGA